MTEPLSEERVLSQIKSWTKVGTGSPSLLIAVDDGSFHLGCYTGMGNSDNIPVEKLEPSFQATIARLYQTGELREMGEAFSLYPQSGFFKKLVSTVSN